METEMQPACCHRCSKSNGGKLKPNRNNSRSRSIDRDCQRDWRPRERRETETSYEEANREWRRKNVWLVGYFLHFQTFFMLVVLLLPSVSSALFSSWRHHRRPHCLIQSRSSTLSLSRFRPCFSKQNATLRLSSPLALSLLLLNCRLLLYLAKVHLILRKRKRIVRYLPLHLLLCHLHSLHPHLSLPLWGPPLFLPTTVLCILISIWRLFMYW